MTRPRLLTPNKIDALIAKRDLMLTRRDGLYDHDVVNRIDAQLATVPAGQDNRVDLALGRSCAVQPPRPNYQRDADLFAASLSPQLAADVEAVQREQENAALVWNTNAEKGAFIRQGVENGKRLREAMTARYDQWQDQTEEHDAFNNIIEAASEIEESPLDWRDMRTHH